MIQDQINPNDWYKVSAVVDEWLDDNDLGNNFFPKALKWAIRALEKAHLNHWQDVKTCLFDVTDRKTVILPADFVDWVIVALPFGQYAITLGVNDKLNNIPRDAAQTNTVTLAQMPNGINFSAYEGYYLFNYNDGQVFSAGTGVPSKGYYKIFNSDTCKELLLDYDYNASQLYIEYITNGFNPCGETVISPYLKEYVLAWMDYKYEDKNNPKATESSKQRKLGELGSEIVILKANTSDLSPQTLLNISRKGFKLTARV